MDRVFVTRVGRRGAIYIPRDVMRVLDINEGDRVLMRVEDDRLILEFIPDPLSLALRIRRWGKTTVEEFERESEEMQNEFY